MGKGYNNYMTKKPFHPGSKANIKRTWMAEQRAENEKKKQDELKTQYHKEQDLYNNRALLSTESKDKLELNFMYEAPPGAKRERQKEDDEPEYKFEWQRKYNAPREDYAKGNDEIRDQPFGIPVRNVRCIKCHKWGHINTDKECPLYSHASTSSMPTTSMDPLELMKQMRDDGYNLKQNVLGHRTNPEHSNQQYIPSDESDPEMEFLKTLSSSQKRKLMKKLHKLSKKQKKKNELAKSKKNKSKKSQDSDDDIISKSKKRQKEKGGNVKADSDEDEVPRKKTKMSIEETTHKSTSTKKEIKEKTKKEHKDKKHKSKKKKSKQDRSSDTDSEEEDAKLHDRKRHVSSVAPIKKDKDVKQYDSGSEESFSKSKKNSKDPHISRHKKTILKTESLSEERDVKPKLHDRKQYDSSAASTRKDLKQYDNMSEEGSSKSKVSKAHCAKDVNPHNKQIFKYESASTDIKKQKSDAGHSPSPKKLSKSDQHHKLDLSAKDLPNKCEKTKIPSSQLPIKAESNSADEDDNTYIPRFLVPDLREYSKSPLHPDGFNPDNPQGYIQDSKLKKEYPQGNHDRFRIRHRHRRSPSVKHKYRISETQK